jgi:prephenate dehydrogenase
VAGRAPASIAVVGLGLVGGSLARAIKARAPGTFVLAVDPDRATRTRALAACAVDVARSRVDEELRRCEVVVVGTPLRAAAPVLAELRPFLAAGVLLTDVIGLKAPVAALVRQELPGVRYVGSHPMAGGELGGFVHSRAELFDGRTVVVCPSRRAKDTAEVDALWRLVGARVVHLTPVEHDRVVAVTSHLPYLAALGLVRVAGHEEAGVHVAGRGFGDATRRADFDPGVMAAVVGHNPHVPRALRALARELERLAVAPAVDGAERARDHVGRVGLEGLGREERGHELALTAPELTVRGE